MIETRRSPPSGRGAGFGACHAWQPDGSEHSSATCAPQNERTGSDDGIPHDSDATLNATEGGLPEERLIGLQLSGNSAALKFAAKHLRMSAAHFALPLDAVQQAILAAIDEGCTVSPTSIAERLKNCEGLTQLPLSCLEYLEAMAQSAIATISDDDTFARMRGMLAEAQQAPHRQRFGHLKLLRADAIEPEEVCWLWKDRLALSKFHLLAGSPGDGKTTIAIALASIVSRGGHFPDGTPSPPGRVIIWTGEDGLADTLVPRILASGGDASRVHFVSGTYDENGKVMPFDPAQDVGRLAEAAAEFPDLKLIVIDPVVSVQARDSYKNADVRQDLQPLVDLAAQTGAAVLGITHFAKSSTGRAPTERVIGSIAFAAVARVIMATARPKKPNACGRLVWIKSNIGPDGGGFEYRLEQVPVAPSSGSTAQRVNWGAELKGEAGKLLAEIECPEEGENSSALGDALEWLHAMLMSGPVPSETVLKRAEEAGHARMTIKRAKEILGVKPMKTRGANGHWVWAMPQHQGAEPAQENPA